MCTRTGSARRSTLFLWALLLPLAGCDASGEGEPPAELALATGAPAPASYVTSPTPEASGRYLVEVGGCNDCHTDGFAATPESVPESQWLTGSAVGFRGPWGTTYPPNLRLTAERLTEDQWVGRLKGTGLPPMPWFSVNRMAEVDARAMYRFVRSLGDPGVAAPAHLPPGVEPTTPWFDFEPHLPAGVATAAGG